ncbi:MAG: efflux RND transporter periplasmic adaptor subunit [Pseudomonadota bacterium]
MDAQGTFSISSISRFLALFLLVLLSILLAGSQSPFGISLASDVTNTDQTVRTLEVAHAEAYTYERLFIGQVEAQQTALTGFEIPGLVSEVRVGEGDIVQRGDLLASLDTARLEALKNEAEASVQRSEADATLAQSTFERVQQARGANAVSALEEDEAREARDATLAALNVAQARLDSILVDIGKAQLIAPFDGTVTRRHVDEGTVINSGAPILEIQENANLEARVGVTSDVAARLEVGMGKTIVLESDAVEAVVSAVIPVRQQTRTVDIILEIKDAPEAIRPGDIVRVPIDYAIEQRGLWVPLNALTEGIRGLWSVFAVEQDNGADVVQRRTVEVHYTTAEQAFVSGALSDGDRLVIEGGSKLVPGQLVKTVEETSHAF